MSTEIGEYRLIGQLGEGAAAVVYLATPIKEKIFAHPGDLVALKIYKPEILKEPKQIERIRREFRIGSQISHPNIVRIYDFNVEKTDKPFLVMEYVDGVTLDKWLDRWRQKEERIYAIKSYPPQPTEFLIWMEPVNLQASLIVRCLSEQRYLEGRESLLIKDEQHDYRIQCLPLSQTDVISMLVYSTT